MLFQGGQHRLELVKVESVADLEIGDLPLPGPLVDRARTDGQARGEFLLFDQGGRDGNCFVDWIAGVGRLDGACGDGGFHDALSVVSTHGLSRRHDKFFNRSLIDGFSQGGCQPSGGSIDHHAFVASSSTISR